MQLCNFITLILYVIGAACFCIFMTIGIGIGAILEIKEGKTIIANIVIIIGNIFMFVGTIICIGNLVGISGIILNLGTALGVGGFFLMLLGFSQSKEN